ncbi:MAG: hypothetical protein K5798_02015 [Nitrosopumilus sp.]|uniref:hypothetical protein n=1 Tax=Nitrosopumilus sp. TaxID=2024843 RepID=UPI002430FF5B|nr:hypothetical protein [Nitrosopumilus sp.]MCV0366025.1 hypothetical protein [Nitrosopumilus sp.]
MNRNNQLRNLFFSYRYAILTAVVFLTTFGIVDIIIGAIWDTISHALRKPENFWTMPHLVVYVGISMIFLSGIIGIVLLKIVQFDKMTKRGIQIVLSGAIVQIVSSMSDLISHHIFGNDGLISLSHQTLEIGIILSAFGAVLIIKSKYNQKFKKILPVAIINLLISIIWLGFNFMLIAASPIICALYYEFFSIGCIIM